jgi:probable rRNA maturation factor
MAPKVEFVETSRRWRNVLSARKLARDAIVAATEASGARLARGAELTVHLLCDDEVRALNAQWRAKDSATNVLSFPAAAPDQISRARLLGDILLAFETVEREAQAEDKTFADHYRHLVVHGFLHLLGYDHVATPDAEAMEALETRTLARLGIADPYASSELETTPTP